MGEEFRFGLKQRVYNRNMRLARLKLGYSQKLLADVVGVSSGVINTFESLRGFPSMDTAKRIADTLEVSLESIFPSWLKSLKIKSYPKTIEERSISLEELISRRQFKLPSESFTLEKSNFEAMNRISLKDQIKEVLRTISSRQKKILELRFGLESGKPMTLEDVGKVFSVSKDRVRQIEIKALKELRHPIRSRYLREFLSI